MYFELQPEHRDPARIRREREKARQLKKTQWWLTLLNRGLCHYCGQKFSSKDLTMDHVIPLARGGRSHRGNLVPACRKCNTEKKLETPIDSLFSSLS